MFTVITKFFCVIAVLFFALGQTPAVADTESSEPLNVAVFPFQIHSDEDISYLSRGIVDMLSSRFFNEETTLIISREKIAKTLAKVSMSRISETTVRKIGKKLEADYVIYGSVTHLKNSSSIDAKALDVSGKNPTFLFYKQSGSMGDVLDGINLLAIDVNEKIFGVKTALAPPTIEAAQPVQKPIQAADPYDHPENKYAARSNQLLETSLSKETDLSPATPVAFQKEISGFLKSKNFKTILKSIATGDVDGNGDIETVFISNRGIYVYRLIDGVFSKLHEIKGPKQQKYLSVDVGDINKNGRAEIFVTFKKTHSKAIGSFVLEWHENDFKKIATDKNHYYRVIHHPDQGPILLTQKTGISDLFLPGISKVKWDGDGYAETDKINLPPSIFIYGFTLGNITDDGQEKTISMGQDDYINVFSESEDLEWKSQENYGGSESYLDDSGATEFAKRTYIPQRLFVADIDKDGKKELITVKNESKSGRFFKKYRLYNSSQFESLSWDGLGLSPVWRTKKISGYISDFAVADVDNDGALEIVGTVVMKRGNFFKKGSSAILVYDIQ